MPAFVLNGPDIPESLLQEHESGRVVFFCGAGISIPAGLPDFRGLVEKMYDELGTSKKRIEKESFDNKQYDVTIELLERRYPGNKPVVREKLKTILEPKLRRKNATVTHQALLQLAKDRKDKVRIVTTNFDRIFGHVIKKGKFNAPLLAAPYLPIPKPSRWHGVVHLHGLLPDEPNDMELNQLVLSSGDFGLAYLTERWAARFVSELFRNYTVCFVGYGINDPVLRYMMDALAADRTLGEVIHEAYAFAGFKDGDEKQTRIEWEAKGVKPLLYKIPTEENHSMLHRTLKEWADTYRDGVNGKRMIIVQHASKPPLTSERSDFVVKRVLWALTDKAAAKYFAELNPVPPLEWLEPLSKNQFGHDDLSRFGIVPERGKDKNNLFNFLCRPTPYTLAPQMYIAGMKRKESHWDVIMSNLAWWLTRHLNDPKLFFWLVECGGELHNIFVSIVRQQIKKYDQLEKENKHKEIEEIRSNSPNAIPNKSMRTLWDFLLSGRVKTRMHEYSLHEWNSRFQQNGLTPILRLELRELLSPCVSFRRPFHHLIEESAISTEIRIRNYADCNFMLRSNNAHYTFGDIKKKPEWKTALPDLLYDFTVLLHDTLVLMRELECADEKIDLSYIHQPSISNHSQNNDFHEWTVLIKLNRDAWIATAKSNPARAHHIAEHWWQIPYPVFKRLVFFAATYRNIISQEQAFNWLLSDNQWWLWSSETRRETIRLMVTLAPDLSEERLNKLEQAILSGPPRKMLRENLEYVKWPEIVEFTILLRLSKIEATGVSLGQNAKNKLTELKKKHPQWRIAEDESDEFSIYIESGSGLSDCISVPKSRRELVEYLKAHQERKHWQQDDWQLRCCDDFPTTACALCQLAREGNWLTTRWNQALQAWKEDAYLRRSWRYIASIIYKAPDEILKEISHNLSWWIEAQAKTFEGKEKMFFQLSERILKIEHEDNNSETDNPVLNDDPVFHAINHPIGHITQGLLSWLYRQVSKGAEGLSDEIKPLFSKICDTKIEQFRHGRIQLATHTIFLFRIDEEWTRSHLLPLFNWDNSEDESRWAWIGFLRAPRIYPPLLSVIKKDFLKTAYYYEKINPHSMQYADLLTFLALDRDETFTIQELADATNVLPQEGLKHSTLTLVRAIEGAGEQKDEYWRNRMFPYIQNTWPKDEVKIDSYISEQFAHICLAVENEFPNALKKLKPWLRPVHMSDILIRDLNETDPNLCQQFPDDALDFLDAIIGKGVLTYHEELQECLDKIKRAKPQLDKDKRFDRLMEICRMRNIS